MKLAKESSFDEIYAELFSPVFRFVRLRVQDAEVEDVTAEIMVRIWKSWEGFEGRGSTRSWALTIAARTIADYYQKTKNVQLMPLSESMAVSRSLDDEVAVAVAVSEVLARLSEPQVSVIQLRLIEGFDAVETASMLGMSREAVDSLLYRARKKFRTLYAHATGGEAHG